MSSFRTWRKNVKTSANIAFDSLNDSPMRAYRLKSFGSLDGLEVAEQPIPSPGAGEVLVRVRASSFNFRDLLIINGVYPIPVLPGRVPLSDAAGEIVAVGAGVARFKVGDRVINSFFPNWFGGSFNQMPDQYVADRDGWLTEYKVVSAEALVSMPEHLTFEEAATLPCAAVTAWSALAGTGSGDTVLTEGTGGVSLKTVAYGGQVSLVGVLGGAAGGLDFMTMFMSQATFRPIAIGSRRDLEDVGRVMKQHDVRPVIDSAFAFDGAAAAFQHFAERQLFGKVVIRH